MIFIILFVVLVFIFVGVGFFIWRNLLRFAKGVERGIKMVPLLIDLPPPSDDTEIGTRDVRDVIQEKISQAEILYNLIAGTARQGFKSRFYGQRHISFELVAINGVIRFYSAVPVILTPVVRQAILTAYPGALIEEVEDHNVFSPTGKITGTIGGEVILKEPYSYPIATFSELKRDAMQAIINALSSLESGDGAGIQFLIRPAFKGWAKASESLVEKKRKNKKSGGIISVRSLVEAPFKVPEKKEEESAPKQLSSKENATLDAIEEKSKHPGYEVLIRVIVSSGTIIRSQAVLHNIVNAFSLFESPGMNGFKFTEAKDIENFVTAFIFRFFPPEARSNILNTVELATVFHFPEYQFTHTSQVQRQFSRQVESPSRLPEQGLLLGSNYYRGVKKEIRLSVEDRARHTYVVGQTGTGKSTLMENMIVQDMLSGKGFAFIDPHGDAAEDLLSMVPKNRTEDVIYFNPGDMQFPLGLNMFEFDAPEQKDFLIQEAINMLYRLYDPQHQGIIGPRYEHWFRNASLTLMSDPAGATFIEIPKVFTDKAYLRQKLAHVTDPTVLDFWNKEMAQTSDYHKSEILGWFVSKFGAFMSNEMMRNIIGQVKSALNLREIMDDGKILIANLSKGRVGELNSMLLGMIFITKFQAAAMSRASMPENQRRDFALYVDEFQNFSTDSFAYILSEARKYHLNLVVANQFISQLTDEIRDAVFGNVGTILSFRTGPNDADFLVKQFSPAFDARDLVNLPNFNAAVRLMIGGLPSQPFSMKSLPPLRILNLNLGVALKQLSAAKFGKPRAQVEVDIFKRLESTPLAPPRLGTQSAAPNLPPQSRGNSGSSFLDEWLAKRRQSPPLPDSAKAASPVTVTSQVQAAKLTRPATSSPHSSDQPMPKASPNPSSDVVRPPAAAGAGAGAQASARLASSPLQSHPPSQPPKSQPMPSALPTPGLSATTAPYLASLPAKKPPPARAQSFLPVHSPQPKTQTKTADGFLPTPESHPGSFGASESQHKPKNVARPPEKESLLSLNKQAEELLTESRTTPAEAGSKPAQNSDIPGEVIVKIEEEIPTAGSASKNPESILKPGARINPNVSETAVDLEHSSQSASRKVGRQGTDANPVIPALIEQELETTIENGRKGEAKEPVTNKPKPDIKLSPLRDTGPISPHAADLVDGEIYIDKQGTIHQGSLDSPD